MIYFDNAATTFPKPKIVADSVYNAIIKYGGNPGRSGHKMSLNAAKIVYNLREISAEFFGISDSEKVILTKNCSESLNIAINSIMKNGGNALISHFEHNSVVRPLENLKKQGICDYKVANCSFEDAQILKNSFEKLIDKNTKMIICTHASNVTGKISPIKELSELCKKYNLIFCVDAAQTAGLLKINMEKDCIDILCCPGHKALFGPTGTGLLIINKNIDLSPIIYGGTGSLSVSLDMPEFYPDKLESGTINVVGAAGLYSGIKFINNYGIEKIENREKTLLKRLFKQLSSIPHVYLLSDNTNNQVSTLSFGVKGKTSTVVSEYLNTKNIAVRGGLHCSPLAHSFLGTIETGTVRVSMSIFNNINEIDYLCNVIDKIK